MSLAHVSEGEEAVFTAGIRATALAQTARAGYATPLAFVISCQLYETFLEQSGLTQWITHLYKRLPETHEGYEEAYAELKKLFSQIQFSGNLREEFLEAYESLAVDATSDMETLVTNEADAKVRIIPSPDYQSTKDFSLAIQQNIKGEHNFLQAIMKTWLSYFKPELVSERKAKGMDIDDFKVALLVEQEGQTEFSAEGFYTKARAAHPIKILSYRGVLDTDNIATKDEHLIANDPLDIVKTTVRHQTQKKVFGEQSGKVELIDIGTQGIHQKLHIRTLLELGRLSKRAHITLEKDVHCYFSIHADKVKLISVEPKKSEQNDTYKGTEIHVPKNELENFPLTSLPLPKKQVDDGDQGELFTADDLLRAAEDNDIENTEQEDVEVGQEQEEQEQENPFVDVDELIPLVDEVQEETFVENVVSLTEQNDYLEEYTDEEEAVALEQVTVHKEMEQETMNAEELKSYDSQTLHSQSEEYATSEQKPELLEQTKEEVYTEETTEQSTPFMPEEEREDLGIIFADEQKEEASGNIYDVSSQETEHSPLLPEKNIATEETLFDLFTAENEELMPILRVQKQEKRVLSPEAAKTAANIFVRHVSNMIKSYQRKGIDIISEREMLLLNAFENRLLQGEEASDVMIGLAWRAQHLINLLE